MTVRLDETKTVYQHPLLHWQLRICVAWQYRNLLQSWANERRWICEITCFPTEVVEGWLVVDGLGVSYAAHHEQQYRQALSFEHRDSTGRYSNYFTSHCTVLSLKISAQLLADSVIYLDYYLGSSSLLMRYTIGNQF